MAGAPLAEVVLADAAVEAPKPVAVTAEQTAIADSPQLAQVDGTAITATPAGSGPAATDPGSPIASSTAGDAPGGASEDQGFSAPKAPEPKPE